MLDINDLDNFKDMAIGDAIDDLSDIIIDLLEIKWRIESNSLATVFGISSSFFTDILNNTCLIC